MPLADNIVRKSSTTTVGCCCEHTYDCTFANIFCYVWWSGTDTTLLGCCCKHIYIYNTVVRLRTYYTTLEWRRWYHFLVLSGQLVMCITIFQFFKVGWCSRLQIPIQREKMWPGRRKHVWQKLCDGDLATEILRRRSWQIFTPNSVFIPLVFFFVTISDTKPGIKKNFNNIVSLKRFLK